MEKSSYEMVMGLAKSDFTFEMLIQAAMIKAKAGKNLAKLQIEFFDLWYQLVNSAKLAGIKPERRKSGKVIWLDDRRRRKWRIQHTTIERLIGWLSLAHSVVRLRLLGVGHENLKVFIFFAIMVRV